LECVPCRRSYSIFTRKTFCEHQKNTQHCHHIHAQTLAYNPDGTLASRKDGNNQITRFSNYKHGLAQSVTYPNATLESAVVNNIGLITSTTD
jgi:hypothetical protein